MMSTPLSQVSLNPAGMIRLCLSAFQHSRLAYDDALPPGVQCSFQAQWQSSDLRCWGNLLKWACLFIQAVSALVAIAIVQSDNRLASIFALGIFATGIAASVLLIVAHD